MKRQQSLYQKCQAIPKPVQDIPEQQVSNSVVQPQKQSDDINSSKQPASMNNICRRIKQLEQKYDQVLIEQEIQNKKLRQIESIIPVQSINAPVIPSINEQRIELFRQKDITIQRMQEFIEEYKNKINQVLLLIETNNNKYLMAMAQKTKQIENKQAGFQLKQQPEFMEIKQDNKLQQIQQLIDDQQQSKQQNSLDSQPQFQQQINELETQFKNIKIQFNSFGNIMSKHSIDIDSFNLWKQEVQGQTINMTKCLAQISNIKSQLKGQQEQITEIEIVIKDNKLLPSTANIFKKNNINQDHIAEFKTQRRDQLNPQSIPNQLYLAQIIPISKAKILIDKLYNLSTQRRVIPEEFKAFVGSKQNFQGLLKEYGATGQFQQLLATTLLDGFRKVRTDGNSFYTSLIFQYLLLVLSKYDNQMFDKFMNNVKTMRFELIYGEGVRIQQDDEKKLKEEFLEQLQRLRYSDNKEMALEEAFDNQDIFCGLAIIHIRNLAYQLYQKEQQFQFFNNKNSDTDIITWESSKRDQITVVISLLAKHLDLQIIVYYIDNCNCFKLSNGEEGKEKVFLIHHPEHYQIGIEYIHKNS